MLKLVLFNHHNRPLDMVDDYLKEDFQRELAYIDKLYQYFRPLGFSFSCETSPTGAIGFEGVIPDTKYAGEEELPLDTRFFLTSVELTGDNLNIHTVDPELIEFVSNWKNNRIITYRDIVNRWPNIINRFAYVDLKRPDEHGGNFQPEDDVH